MKGKDIENNISSMLELTKFVGSGWKPISVRTHRCREGVNVLKQTITLYYVKEDDLDGQVDFDNKANLRIHVFSEDN